MTRDEAIEAVVATGKTREQAEAFIELMRSAFARRGWVEGEPLTQDEIGEQLGTFMGTGDGDEH